MFARLFATNDKPYIPGWDKRQRVEFDLSGVRLSLELPESKVKMGGSFMASGAHNIYDLNAYDLVRDDTLTSLRSPFRNMLLIREEWDALGSVLGMLSGSISFALNVVFVEDLPEGKSCFNPSDFLQVVDRDMYFRFGPPNLDSFMPMTPHRWWAGQLGSMEWVHYQSITDVNRYGSEIPTWLKNKADLIFLTPIDDRHFIVCAFSYSGFPYGSAAAELIREKMFEFVSSIHCAGKELANGFEQLCVGREYFFWHEHNKRNVFDENGNSSVEIELVGTKAPEYL